MLCTGREEATGQQRAIKPPTSHHEIGTVGLGRDRSKVSFLLASFPTFPIPYETTTNCTLQSSKYILRTQHF